jgi:hypothetical protein
MGGDVIFRCAFRSETVPKGGDVMAKKKAAKKSKKH